MDIDLYIFLNMKAKRVSKIEKELFNGLFVKMVSDKGLVVRETDLTVS